MVPFQLEILFYHRMCLVPVCMLSVLALAKKSFVFLASVLLKHERDYEYAFYFFLIKVLIKSSCNACSITPKLLYSYIILLFLSLEKYGIG